MKKRVKYLALSLVVLGVVAGIGISSQTIRAEESKDGVIPEHVSIGDVDVSGMTLEEATEAVDAYVESAISDVEFTLSTGEKSVEVSGETLGLHWANTQIVEDALTIGKSGNLLERYKAKKDLDQNGKNYKIVYGVDQNLTESYLEEQKTNLSVKTVNNGLVRENGSFRIVEGTEGVSLKVEESVDAIQSFLADAWDGSEETISLATEITEPEGTVEELQKVKDLLGSYNTNYSSSGAERCKNIANAVSFINGTVLYPGEEFSVYDTIGPLDESNGYELAGAYENGVTVQAYGGGVCQVSTTLYNAVLFAELEVTKRSNHSMLVSYVDPGRDAAIAGDYKNFKFVNNTDAPIYIEGYVSGKNVYFNIFGEETRPSNRSISFQSVVTSEDAKTYSFTGTSNPIGYLATTASAHIGKTAELWKIVTVDGVEESREKINTSKYSSSPQKMNVGIASDNPEATAAMQAAIGSGSLEAVQNVIATYGAGGTGTTATTDNANTDASAVQQPAADQAASTDAAASTDTTAADTAAQAATTDTGAAQ